MNIKCAFNNNRGQAIVETALVLPMVVLLLFAIVEFGQVINQYLVLTAAAREGARAAAVGDDATAQTAIANSVANINHNGMTVSIAYPNGIREQGNPVTVTISKPIEVSTPIVKNIIDNAFAPGLPVITARSVMRVEQP